MKILFTGGGTGGHIFPIIAIVRKIRKIYINKKGSEKELRFFYLGPKDDFSLMLLSKENIEVKIISSGKIRRYVNWKSILENFIDIFLKIPMGIIQSFFYIFLLSPDIIFSKGGYGSIPVVISGWIFQTPIFLHESDATPGLANKILSKFSKKIFTSFPKTEYLSPQKIISVGNPIREEILEGSKEKGEKLFKLSKEKPVILILGGSQGAERINNLLLTILPKILAEFEIIHQCGQKNFNQVKAEAKVMLEKNKNLEKFYHPFPFLKERELKHAYKISDLIVSRAGSGSIFEIAALGKPSILIPLPEAAQNHQIKNAYAFAENGAAVVIEEANLSPYFFLEKLKHLFSHPEELEKMSRKAKEFARPEAAQALAEYILDYLEIKS